MANNVTETIALLDAIIKRAGAIKNRSLEIIDEENMLVEDLDRYDMLVSPDDELRVEVEEKEEKRKKKRKKRFLVLKRGSSASPAKKTKQGSATGAGAGAEAGAGAGAGTGTGAGVCPAREDIPIVEAKRGQGVCTMSPISQSKRSAYWQSIIEKYHRSPLSIKNFCQEETFSVNQFRYWLYL